MSEKDTKDKLKEKVGSVELAETLEEIIEEKVEERVQKRIEKQEKKPKKNSNVSRRDFIKKMGVGALGIGAVSLIPSTSALDVRDSTGLNVYQNGTEYLDVDSSAVNVLNTVLQEQGNRVATRTWVNNNTSSFSGSHNDLTNVNTNDHHSRYTDSEAVSAIESNTLTDIAIDDSRPSLKLIDNDSADRKRLWTELHGDQI